MENKDYLDENNEFDLSLTGISLDMYESLKEQNEENTIRFQKIDKDKLLEDTITDLYGDNNE